MFDGKVSTWTNVFEHRRMGGLGIHGVYVNSIIVAIKAHEIMYNLWNSYF